MKFYLMIFLILIFASAVAAQQRPDYSGVWIYDKIISQPDEPLRTATFKMFITQTPSEIKIGILQIAPGVQITNDQTPVNEVTYYFDKQNKTAVQSPPVKPTFKVEKVEKGVLSLITEDVVKASNGRDVPLKIRETFERLPGGDSLKIHRQVFVDRTFPILEIFIAKSQLNGTVTGHLVEDISSLKAQFPRATLNNKVKHFRDPEYPDYVKNSPVMDSNSIKVIFDEAGKVVFAQSYLGSSLIKSKTTEAAMQCIFDPVTVDGKPIMVSGNITYSIGGPLQPWK